MNEIDKLKIENERYKKALQKICHGYAVHTNAAQWAEIALNPAPLAPVTLESLITALKNFNKDRALASIKHFSDGSGEIRSGGNLVYTFYSLQEAFDVLNARKD